MPRSVGSSLPRFDARAKVSGQLRYPGDFDLPGQLHAKILWPAHPHARITRFDIGPALAAPGVVAVLAAADVPVNEYGLNVRDQEVLVGRVGGIVRCLLDQVAVVVAETEAQAEAALALIDIAYEILPGVYSIAAALAPDAPLVHPERGDSNVLLHYKIRHGDVEAAFAQADIIIEHDYSSHPQEHAYLQPEAGLASLRGDGKIEVIVAGQWLHEDRHQIAHALGLPVEQIVVRYPGIGGAFGGREDMSVQIVLALAAWKLGRPVKMQWSRGESIRGHHKRHAAVAHAKWGATKDGRVLAMQVDVSTDAGAYAYTSTKVLGNLTLACLGPYEVANVRVDTRTVYTNNLAAGAFRGFGGPQGHWIAEMQMNRLAAALEMDPVEVRLRNLLREGSILATGSVIPSGVTIDQVLQTCAQAAGWVQGPRGWQRPPQAAPADDLPSPHRAYSLDAAPARRARGVGIACCFKNVGFSLGYVDECWAGVELYGDGSIERAVVRHAGAEVGQGAHQIMRQIAADVLRLPLEQVELIAEDTDATRNSGSASASRMTFMAGNAILGAAQQALQKWQNEEDRPCVAEYRYLPRPTTPYDHDTGAGDPNITYGYCAQAAEVEVDLDSGRIQVLRLWSVNDVGRALNPQLVAAQIEGAVAQSVGWTLQEDFKQAQGSVLTDQLSTYLIPTVLDTPLEIIPIILELPDPQGPLGARGMAEMPFIPTAPAIAAAVHAATGRWFHALPLTPERVVGGGRWLVG
ncbi:MAG: xanthine dehydrogenase family protein [Caldilineales bacterium]|nr:xanthine dehydrogenase family protein [Caldilineales bacterium]